MPARVLALHLRPQRLPKILVIRQQQRLAGIFMLLLTIHTAFLNKRLKQQQQQNPTRNIYYEVCAISDRVCYITLHRDGRGAQDEWRRPARHYRRLLAHVSR